MLSNGPCQNSSEIVETGGSLVTSHWIVRVSPGFGRRVTKNAIVESESNKCGRLVVKRHILWRCTKLPNYKVGSSNIPCHLLDLPKEQCLSAKKTSASLTMHPSWCWWFRWANISASVIWQEEEQDIGEISWQQAHEYGSHPHDLTISAPNVRRVYIQRITCTSVHLHD